jgi:hypothetical protein
VHLSRSPLGTATRASSPILHQQRIPAWASSQGDSRQSCDGNVVTVIKVSRSTAAAPPRRRLRSGRCSGSPQEAILGSEGQVGDGHEQNDVSQKAEPGLADAGCPWDLEATAGNAEAPQ